MSARLAIPAIFFALTGLLAGTSAAGAPSADGPGRYPSRPVRIVVPFTPGGQPDIVARLLAPRLAEALGQPAIVDNRPGAGGTIGSRIVAGATPDGHTLLAISAAHVVNPAVRANLGYDPVKDFAGVTMTINAAYLLVVPNSLPVKTVKDLIALARGKPGFLNFTSAGRGSSTHFAAEMFRQNAAIDVVHVPHRGIPEALTDTLTGRVHFFMAPIGSAIALVKDGKLRALAVSTQQRARAFPELPTIAEAALPGFRYDSWGAVFAPARTPRPIVVRLNAELVRILGLPEVGERLLALGMEPAPMAPEELDRFVAREAATALALAKRAGIQPE